VHNVLFVIVHNVPTVHYVHMNATRRSSKPSTDSRKAVVYVRVSTEDQNLGPDAQRAAVAAWADRNGVEIVATFEDKGVSGGAAIDRRPALLAALDALAEHGAGLFVVAKRDRLARDIMIAAAIERLAERAGARIVSADGVGEGNDPAAALLRGMVDLFAAYERAMIRTRTVAALAQKKARGERTGAVPVGCRVAADGRTLETDPAEAEIVAAVVKARAAGLSIREIAAELAAAGMRTRRGGEIQSTQVARILRRAA
jgi:DNA invertase Pin-like site-specific DNA recombinase